MVTTEEEAAQGLKTDIEANRVARRSLTEEIVTRQIRMRKLQQASAILHSRLAQLEGAS